ncbi:lytic transglycosylase [Marinihelvus fidelis]|uniref:lytic transglycosylase n=1 Tax=Marinihelvus fidelis TaxID=2613842 RepID=UPI0017842861|nr:LysM peptidoglycan-binding domain-containing protein [Marinihelvus fidelis]
MSLRWMLPLAGLVLASCATTAPQSPPTDLTTEPRMKTAATPERAESVDDHLPKLAREPAATPVADAHVHESPWERMMHSFALPDCASHEASRDWAQWYADRPEYMARVFKRAEPWIYFIVEELEFRGLPGELALLPIVESAYDPFAYSSGRALGAWQFVAATGRDFGLNQNWWYDGRRDVWASTYAALDYLMYLNDMFEGDWLLALAAYNSGQGRVSRAVKRNVRNGKPGDFWNLKLPRETRGYVPKMLGLTCLFLNAQEYGFKMPDTPDQPVIAAVDFGTQTDLVLVSQLAEVPIDQVFALNPGYNRWATSPDGPYRVVLPVDAAERLEQKMENRNPSELMRWDQVTVQSGDTLSKLAQVHHVPVSVIRSANDLASDRINVGQKIRLPRDSQMALDPRYAAAAAELAELQSGLLAADRTTYTVRRGDSLSVIARRYNVSVKELQAWNNISNPRMIRAGQRLTVFQSPAPRGSSQPASRDYTVRSGDSLWSIARKHKVKLNDLMRWNGLSRGSVLQPGQSLKIMF